MGNCQAAEAATVVIHHPSEKKIERIYWSVTASDVMGKNPGHYVAMVVTSPSLKSENGSPVNQLKLLRPADTLLIGHVYRLVSFEDVLKEFAAKKCVKLGKLLRDKGALELKKKKKEKEPGGFSGQDPNHNPDPDPRDPVKVKRKTEEAKQTESGDADAGTGAGADVGAYTRRNHHGGVRGQWRPALQSIAEIGT